MSEFDTEPVRGLPQILPPGEHIVWHGAPSAWGIARQALMVPYVAAYFGVMIVWHVGSMLSSGSSLADVAASLSWTLPLAASALAILGLIASAIQRSTVYTITNRRVVLRFGVALPMATNIPLSSIQSAGLRSDRHGNGDISLVVGRDHAVSYILLWPHVRPWRWSSHEPTLRAIPDAAVVAEKLGRALAAASAPRQPKPVSATAPRPAAAVRPRTHAQAQLAVH